MSVNVYWSFLGQEWMRAEKPTPIFKRARDTFISQDTQEISSMFKCPATVNWLNNTYGLKSVYDYQLFKNLDSTYSTDMYDRDFFNNHVQLRDPSAGFISFRQQYIFFTDEDSLEVTVQIPPFLENTELSNGIQTIPGTFDIGKWFRPVDFAFFLKNTNKFSIKEGDIYSYLKFHSEEKINFIKFMPTEKIYFYAGSSSNTSVGRFIGKRKLPDFYRYMTFKKKILKEIKENVA